MDKRSLIFVFVGTGLLFAFLLMQGINGDKDLDTEQASVVNVQADDAKATDSKATDDKAAAVDNVDADNEESKNGDEESAEKDEPVESGIAEVGAKEDSNTGETSTDEDAESEDAESEDAKADAEPVAETPSVPEPDQEYVTIGSLEKSSPYLMLVTANTQGATVTRVELSARLKSGRYRYRDLDDHSGYLGHLFLVNVAGGCKVRVVGDGTPAALATAAGVEGGIKSGDIITEFDSQVVETVESLEALLADTHPKDKVSLKVIRDGKLINFEAILTARPMEVLRPEYDPGFQHPESFLMSLRKPGKPGDDWEILDPSLIEGNWKIAGKTTSKVVFEKSLRSSELFSGELIIRKIYRVAEVPNDATELKLPAAYHLYTDIEVEQIGGEPQEISLQVNGPTGAPIEGWWYTNKISGKTASLFSAAGARDVVLSTEANSFTFYGGPEIFSQAISKEGEPKSIAAFTTQSTVDQKTIKFAGVDAQYFTVAMLPDNEENPFVVSNMYISPVHPVTKADKKVRKKVDFSFRMYGEPIKIGPGETYSQSFKVFAGPKEPELLMQYGLQDTQTFGWFAIFSKILLSMLHFFHMIFRNYGVAIILLTVLVRLAMTPISRKAALNAQMMQMLQPEMKKLADKYKNDMEKRGQAQRELFKRYNYNPFGGCMLMFLQLPIFIGLYRGLSVDVALRDQPLIPGISWCSNLAGPDQLWYWKDVIPFEWLTGETGWLGPYLNILPLITVVLFLIQQKLFTPPPTDEQQAMTQKMMTFMMLFIGLMFFKVPSGLCIYFITSSLWGIAERKLLPKPVLDKTKFDDLDAKEDKKKSNESKKGFLSLANTMGNGKNSKNGSAEDRKRRDKERQRKLRDKQDTADE